MEGSAVLPPCKAYGPTDAIATLKNKKTIAKPKKKVNNKDLQQTRKSNSPASESLQHFLRALIYVWVCSGVRMC